MPSRESDLSSEKARLPARDVIEAILENMRKSLEPLKYTTLAPSRYVVYLHPAEYARLEGILVVLREQTIRALSEELFTRNQQSVVRQYAQRLIGKRETPVENPAGEWSVEFFPDADGDIAEGDILVDSELVLPASSGLCSGERTRRVTTLRSGETGRVTSGNQRVIAPVAKDSARPFATIDYDDTAGHHSYDVKSSVTIGRGGVAHPVDIKITSAQDVSREHARIRRDPTTGLFFLVDLSTLGTTLNGRHVPRGYDEVDGVNRENGSETQLPDQCKIGLADTVFLNFSVVRP
jgi:hypothetical protein